MGFPCLIADSHSHVMDLSCGRGIRGGGGLSYSVECNCLLEAQLLALISNKPCWRYYVCVCHYSIYLQDTTLKGNYSIEKVNVQ